MWEWLSNRAQLKKTIREERDKKDALKVKCAGLEEQARTLKAKAKKEAK